AAYSLTCYTRFGGALHMPPNTRRIVVAPAASSTSSSQPAADSSSSRVSKRHKLHKFSTVAAIVLVTACSIIALKIQKWKISISIIDRKNYNNRRDNIKEILGNYGSLAPRSYGMVYKGTVPDGRHVAVKFLHDTTGNGEEFVNEVISIRRTSMSMLALIYDYMPNGSLDKFIYTENSKQTLGWEKLYEIAMGIARGLEYLHRGCNTRIIHFDIKPQNILLDQDFVPKIADFVGFIAPEVFSRRLGSCRQSRTCTTGMVLLEMVGGRKNLRASVERESEVYFPDWVHSHLTQFGSLQSFDLGLDEPEEITKKMATIGLWDDSDEQQNES
ncbi:hypothetical protein ZWY2020_035810, partial [Hordeum vulgare]